MSTQAALSIPLTHTTPQQHYRLLELSPELLELLTSNEPPTLKLKSAPPSQTSSNNGPTGAGTLIDGPLHLCTASKTYQLRQVQSSNSVILVRPTNLPSPPPQPLPPPPQQTVGEASIEAESTDAIRDWDPNTTSAALTAIAQCSATLELVATMQDAVVLLERMMPVWYGMSGKGRGERDAGAISKEEILDDAPMSEAEFEKAWTTLCCFELGGVESYLPSPKAALKVWEKALQSSTLNDIRLDEAGSCGKVISLFLGGMGEGELDEPVELMQSVLKRVADTQGGVDRSRTVDWVGEVLLKVETEDSGGLGVTESGFEERWKGLVLEQWRDDARIEVLDKRSYRRDATDNTIRCAGRGGITASIPTGGVSTKRKWHEKFKAPRA